MTLLSDSPERRFTVRTEKKSNRPGSWDSRLVTVLDRGEPVGSYERNYSSFGEKTFCPFVQDGKHYALYSRDYTATRLMSLPDCVDIGGEDEDECGFCPTELFVPSYRLLESTLCRQSGEEVPYQELVWAHGNAAYNEMRLKQHLERQAAEAESGQPAEGSQFNYRVSDWQSPPFGFISGCHWGDDSSWKTQFIDLSKASQGVLRRQELFGYAPLPSSLTLRQGIDMSSWSPSRNNIGLARMVDYDLTTGKALE